MDQMWLVYLLGVFVAGGIFIAMSNREEARKKLADAKLRYDASLENLTKNPSDSKAQLSCLEFGRVYYQIVIPDTYTVNGYGVQIASQNNSANRESRIQSDIQARIGHLKLAG